LTIKSKKNKNENQRIVGIIRKENAPNSQKNEMICGVGVALKNSKWLQEKDRERERERIKVALRIRRNFSFLSVEFCFLTFR